jgi:hypothetical protein
MDLFRPTTGDSIWIPCCTIFAPTHGVACTALYEVITQKTS